MIIDLSDKRSKSVSDRTAKIENQNWKPKI
jgi:hypothetical protein